MKRWPSPWTRRLLVALLAAQVSVQAWSADAGMEAFKEVLARDDLAGLKQLVTAHRARGEALPRDPLGGASVLHKAIHLGADEPLLAWLLDAGADVHARTSDDAETPLHFAARFGCDYCVRRLLAHGARLDVRDAEGQLPIHVAGYGVVDALLDDGADPLATDPRGNVALHRVFHPRLLVAGVNVRNQGGLTPLHFAALSDSVRGIDWLLAQGADPELETTAVYRYRAPIMSRAFGPGDPIPAGSRPLDLARWKADSTRWNLQTHKQSVAKLEAVTRKRFLGLW
ncbi:MAG: ankyrin repeat domain-containing protein [Moraxellaceae bacterium]|nr:ankyrin repeat domain-containing protein [Moraxellaceae bacterium]